MNTTRPRLLLLLCFTSMFITTAVGPAHGIAPTTGALPETSLELEEHGDYLSAHGETTTEVESMFPEEAKSSPKAQDTPPAVQDGYEAKILGIEHQVNDLKEQIFRSKARLVLLKETVLHGSISGAKAILYHRNEMGSSFKLEQVIYSLDGKAIFKNVDQDGDLSSKKEIEIFNGAIVPGNHNLSVYMIYRGHGYGIFSYLKGYVFKIRSSFAFTVEEGQTVTIKAVGYEKGGITTDLKDRPDIRFDVQRYKEEPQLPLPTSARDLP